MAKVLVQTLRTIWVSVEIDTTDWDEEDRNHDAYVFEATAELLDAIQVTENNSPNVGLCLETLDHTEITVLPQN